MVVVSIPPQAEFGRNDHQEDAPYFTKMSNQSNHFTVASDYQCQFWFLFSSQSIWFWHKIGNCKCRLNHISSQSLCGLVRYQSHFIFPTLPNVISQSFEWETFKTINGDSYTLKLSAKSAKLLYVVKSCTHICEWSLLKILAMICDVMNEKFLNDTWPYIVKWSIKYKNRYH